MTSTSAARSGSALEWTKSSYSGNENGSNCIEVAATPGTIHVRDSKDTTVPHLSISPTAWADFLTHTTS
ncbi:DUF397 domain-containing protein [Streptomyces sp. NBC_01795]|uniref:DUF397 domain-containing protein n=1 Tax=unclassified Streptomyces TaxID=2593676 RepID=UPI002DDA7D29|nr:MULTISPECIES: DUF397 domain-containing protein [unclassified Streptomyces]WSA92571.1 DUF397 domain-containing protein [Streptomyces sp. NBC_01795]WSB76938.1 DUF397 domain-containing protein [Streptomyces sp. NBC_01775]WSS14789.1 DUF397 domain-containing protein [Streptomyces sp. NBC_01186]